MMAARTWESKMQTTRRFVTVAGRRHAVDFSADFTRFAFAGERGWRDVPSLDSYAVTHGGDVFRAAVELAHRIQG